MTETELNALLAGITPANEAARAAAHAHWASLAKPLGGLGRLETMLEDAAALTGSAELDLSRRVVVVLCADNGVVAQGVSQTGQEVTRAVAENLAMRRTSVCQMAARPTAMFCPWIWAWQANRCPACAAAALPQARRILPKALP